MSDSFSVSDPFSESVEHNSHPRVTQDDFYHLLGVSRDASLDEIKKEYRKLSLLYHPDKKTGDEKKYSMINLAFKVLSNEKKRQKYDSALAGTYEELQKVERELGYQRNQDFLKIDPETGKEEFDKEKFAAVFQQQNTTLDQDFQAPQEKVDDDFLNRRLAERDQLLSDLHNQTTDLASDIRNLGQGRPDQFNNSFNQIFEDLKKRNKELVETNQSADPAFDGSQISSGWSYGSNLGGSMGFMAGSAWDNQPQTGIMTSGEQINLTGPGFQTEQVQTSLKNSLNQSQIMDEWKVKTPEELLMARMAEYQADSELLKSYKDTDFEVNHNPDLLSCQELENTPLDDSEAEEAEETEAE